MTPRCARARVQMRRGPWSRSVGSSKVVHRTARALVTVQARWPLISTRTLRGALAGAVAAAVWAAQQPLDKRVFGVDYDDAELLGRLRHARAGAAYADRPRAARRQRRAVRRRSTRTCARRCRCPPALRGPLAGAGRAPRDLAGARALLARVHPAREQLPQLWGSGRAFAQATWRHLLFGTVLGELERRLNPPEPEPQPVDPAAAAVQRPRLAPSTWSRLSSSSERASSITGASGFAGRHLVAACEADGDDVVAAPPSRRRRPARRRRRARGVAAARARTSSTTSPPGRTSGASWEDPLGDARRQRRR